MRENVVRFSDYERRDKPDDVPLQVEADIIILPVVSIERIDPPFQLDTSTKIQFPL